MAQPGIALLFSDCRSTPTFSNYEEKKYILYSNVNKTIDISKIYSLLSYPSIIVDRFYRLFKSYTRLHFVLIMPIADHIFMEIRKITRIIH